MLVKWISCLGLGAGLCLKAWAQPVAIELQGGFVVDSTRLGLPTPFVVTALYPSEQPVFFVDSTYDFSPFEWSHMRYFPSQMREGRIYDSVIYYLTPFLLDSVQHIRLPFRWLRKKDTVVAYTQIDSVHIAGLLPPPSSPEEAQLQSQIVYQNVLLAFNYWLFVGIGGAICVLVIVVFLYGRRPLLRWLRKRRLELRYRRFKEEFATLSRALKKENNLQQLEQMLVLWKSYLEWLEKAPYRKLSTQEICALPEHKILHEPLQLLDRALYGQRTLEKRDECLRALQRVASEKHYQQLQKIYHA